MRYHCRCTSKKCQRRKVLPRHPLNYIRDKKCSFCGSPMRVDKWMQYRNTSLQGMGCTCEGYTFLHRKGSKYCTVRKDGTKRVYGDLDFADRYVEWHEEKHKDDWDFETENVSNDWAEEA